MTEPEPPGADGGGAGTVDQPLLPQATPVTDPLAPPSPEMASNDDKVANTEVPDTEVAAPSEDNPPGDGYVTSTTVVQENDTVATDINDSEQLKGVDPIENDIGKENHDSAKDAPAPANVVVTTTKESAKEEQPQHEDSRDEQEQQQQNKDVVEGSTEPSGAMSRMGVSNRRLDKAANVRDKSADTPIPSRIATPTPVVADATNSAASPVSSSPVKRARAPSVTLSAGPAEKKQKTSRRDPLKGRDDAPSAAFQAAGVMANGLYQYAVEMEKLQNGIEKKDKRIKVLNQANIDLISEKAELSRRLASLEQKARKVKEAQEEKTESKKEGGQHKKAAEKAEKRVGRLEEKVKGLEDGIEKLKEEKKDLKKELTDQKNETKKWENSSAAWERERYSFENKANKSELEAAEWKKKHGEFLAGGKKKIAGIRSEKENLEKDGRKKDRTIDSLNKKLSRTETNLQIAKDKKAPCQVCTHDATGVILHCAIELYNEQQKRDTPYWHSLRNSLGVLFREFPEHYERREKGKERVEKWLRKQEGKATGDGSNTAGPSLRPRPEDGPCTMCSSEIGATALYWAVQAAARPRKPQDWHEKLNKSMHEWSDEHPELMDRCIAGSVLVGNENAEDSELEDPEESSGSKTDEQAQPPIKSDELDEITILEDIVIFWAFQTCGTFHNYEMPLAELGGALIDYQKVLEKLAEEGKAERSWQDRLDKARNMLKERSAYWFDVPEHTTSENNLGADMTDLVARLPRRIEEMQRGLEKRNGPLSEFREGRTGLEVNKNSTDESSNDQFDSTAMKPHGLSPDGRAAKEIPKSIIDGEDKELEVLKKQLEDARSMLNTSRSITGTIVSLAGALLKEPDTALQDDIPLVRQTVTQVRSKEASLLFVLSEICNRNEFTGGSIAAQIQGKLRALEVAYANEQQSGSRRQNLHDIIESGRSNLQKKSSAKKIPVETPTLENSGKDIGTQPKPVTEASVRESINPENDCKTRNGGVSRVESANSGDMHSLIDIGAESGAQNLVEAAQSMFREEIPRSMAEEERQDELKSPSILEMARDDEGTTESTASTRDLQLARVVASQGTTKSTPDADIPAALKEHNHNQVLADNAPQEPTDDAMASFFRGAAECAAGAESITVNDGMTDSLEDATDGKAYSAKVSQMQLDAKSGDGQTPSMEVHTTPDVVMSIEEDIEESGAHGYHSPRTPDSHDSGSEVTSKHDTEDMHVKVADETIGDPEPGTTFERPLSVSSIEDTELQMPAQNENSTSNSTGTMALADSGGQSSYRADEDIESYFETFNEWRKTDSWEAGGPNAGPTRGVAEQQGAFPRAGSLVSQPTDYGRRDSQLNRGLTPGDPTQDDPAARIRRSGMTPFPGVRGDLTPMDPTRDERMLEEDTDGDESRDKSQSWFPGRLKEEENGDEDEFPFVASQDTTDQFMDLAQQRT